MKKLIIVLIFICIGKYGSAQLFGGKKIQEKANDKLAYAWNYLKSDTLVYKTLMLKDTSLTVAMLHDIKGNPLFAIMPRALIDSTNSSIGSLASHPEYGIMGLEFNISLVEDFSYQKKRDIKNIKDPYQRNMTKTFNKKIKYILMQQSPRAVIGKRITKESDPNYGKIVPDFSPTVVKDNLNIEKKEVPAEVPKTLTPAPQKKPASTPLFPPVQNSKKPTSWRKN